MTYLINTRLLTAYMGQELDNGHYRLTWEQIAKGYFKTTPTEDHIEALRSSWHKTQKRLRRKGTCAILVTAMYFSSRTEPQNPDKIKFCIALHGRPAAGVRLMSLKGSRNDPMAIMWLKLNSRNAQGIQAAILDRITIEVMRGKLAKPTARVLVDVTTQPALPEHEQEFNELMNP